MSTNNVIQILAERLSLVMPCYYQSISALISPRLKGQPFQYEQEPFDIIGMSALEDAALCESYGLVDNLIDTIVSNLKRKLYYAYVAMKPIVKEATEQNWKDELRQIIRLTQKANIPIVIISNGVDLNSLQLTAPHELIHNGLWYFGNTPIYELGMPFESKYQQTFFILSQDDAPFMDFNRALGQIYSQEHSVFSQDPLKSLELYVNYHGNQRMLTTKPLIPMYIYKAQITALRVDIDYDKVVIPNRN